MDLESLKEIVNYQEAIYVAIGAAGIAVGYATGRIIGFFSGKKTGIDFTKIRLSEEETKRANLELDKVRELNIVELMKLRYSNTEADTKKTLALNEQEHKLKLEAIARQSEADLALAEKRRRARQEAIEKLKPLFEEYRDSLASYLVSKPEIDPELRKKRGEYREKLSGDLYDGVDISDLDENEIYANSIKIEALINLRYPISDLQIMPEKLKHLIDIVLDK